MSGTRLKNLFSSLRESARAPRHGLPREFDDFNAPFDSRLDLDAASRIRTFDELIYWEIRARSGM
jgi:hypothetical protein